MTTEQPRSGLPIEFLRTVVAEAGPDSPPVRMAVEKARELPEGSARDGLLLALLLGALSDAAPEWVLQAAVNSDLGKEIKPHYSRPAMPLAEAALAHPSCPDALREEALRRCSVQQLATLGRECCGEALAGAVVAELERRGPHGRFMAPELLKEPSASQLILREPGLHETVFLAALDLLPAHPALDVDDDSESDDTETKFARYRAAREAWETMWGQVVTLHTDRHRQLIEWAGDRPTAYVIRKHLLGTVPWDVEPGLLEEIANDDLADFATSGLITRLCRMLRDGASKEDACSRLADEIDALDASGRADVEHFLCPDISEYGLGAAVSWVEARADGTWRYILSPSEAKSRYGESRTWRVSDELLATLGRRFATTALGALHLWEPETVIGRPRPRDAHWVHVMLLHLPHLTDEVKEKARAVVRYVRSRPHSPWKRVDYTAQQDERRLAEICTAIERILADPATTSRESALGDPGQVTARALADAHAEVLRDYLTRHAGNDDLVEKALLSFAWSSYRPELLFADVLARHSRPETALLRITTDLRRRLGGTPNLRESWARKVLTSPHRTPELVRALPAWTALTVGGPRHGTAHEAVTAVVLAALGNDDAAWSRFAASPASYSGTTAWLRLGDVLDAATEGTAWPKPPDAR